MYRYVVPVDDQVHEIALSTRPGYAAATADERGVEFWCEHLEDGPSFLCYLQVFGTGHPLPPNARWVATCPRTPSGLVWHLYEMEF
jgi:hypothetical protein